MKICESSLQLRKAKLSQLKKARLEGKVAYFSHTKLVIKERSSASSHSGRGPGNGEPGGSEAGGGGSSATAEASVSIVKIQPQGCPSGGLQSNPDDWN